MSGLFRACQSSMRASIKPRHRGCKTDAPRNEERVIDDKRTVPAAAHEGTRVIARNCKGRCRVNVRDVERAEQATKEPTIVAASTPRLAATGQIKAAVDPWLKRTADAKKNTTAKRYGYCSRSATAEFL